MTLVDRIRDGSMDDNRALGHIAADARIKDLGLLAAPTSGPAILVYDIETAPSLVYTWTNWKANVIATERDWYILSFAYRWYGKNTTRFVGLYESPTYDPDAHDDAYVVERLAALFDRADIVVAHNGDKFDQKKANARFMFHGMPPPSPYQEIDTLKESRRYFNLYSHSLDESGRYSNLGRKEQHTGIHMWLGCMAGDMKHWRTMRKYNVRDVKQLEEWYEKVRPWMGRPGKKAHPNMGFWKRNQAACSNCGSTDLVRKGTHRTGVSEFQTFQCQECNAYSRARKRRPQDDGGVRTL